MRNGFVLEFSGIKFALTGCEGEFSYAAPEIVRGFRERGNPDRWEDWLAVDQNKVASDAKGSGSLLLGLSDSVGKCVTVCHQSGGGDDAVLIGLDYGVVYTASKAEIIRIDNEATHAANIIRRGLDWSLDADVDVPRIGGD